MKKATLKMLALAMVCILALGAIACGGEAANEAGGVDWTKYPDKLENWTIADFKDYIRALNIMPDDAFNMDMSAGDLGAIGADAGTMYVDMTAGTYVDIIMLFAADSQVLKDILSTHEAVGQPMDGVLGNFAFQYSTGSDEEHMNALAQAIKDLGAHFGVTPEFFN